ncbi:MAG TPA: hypothetical protein PLA94_19945 [Myxococcota bacterium]|nr:hypothetical protein [Myxococcota bacterium]
MPGPIPVSDQLKMLAIRAARAINERSIQHWSRWTYRRDLPPTDHAPQWVPAASMDPTLPMGLFVPDHIPPSAQLHPAYVWPYYNLTGGLFKLYQKSPLSPTPIYEGQRYFPRSDEGWKDLLEEEEFVALRLCGPNPFLLRQERKDEYVVDYTPWFEGLFAPLSCRFVRSHGVFHLRDITWDGEGIGPQSPRWKQAKLVANALDARIAVFVQHLLQAHLRVGQSFALASAQLPPGHPLRPFVDIHTYGSLQVNHYAWNFLLSPASYFILSGFIRRDQGIRLFRNTLGQDGLAPLDPLSDLEHRGLRGLDGHPYAEDAELLWPILWEHCGELVQARYASDAQLAADPHIVRWNTYLNNGLSPMPLESRKDLQRRLSTLLYNNVLHEISGDFAIYACPQDPYQQKIIRWDGLLAEQPAALRDVFLFDQGAWSGMFNTAGNNLMNTPLERFVDDARTLEELARLRGHLARAETELVRRNQSRRFRFDRMLPSQWELSISF